MELETEKFRVSLLDNFVNTTNVTYGFLIVGDTFA